MLRVVPEDDAGQEFALSLDEICRHGAERMLAVALEAEVDAHLSATERLETTAAMPWWSATARPGKLTGYFPPG
jgi:hypothetical protein